MKHMRHGMRNTRLYGVYANMKNRCYNPNNDMRRYYLDKEIKLCDEWRDDPNSFLEWSLANGYSDELTIDRIDGSKDYSPENCRWETMNVQMANRNMFKNNTSGYVGVNNRPGNKVQVQINEYGKRKILGTFDFPWTAAMARDSYIIMNKLPNKLTY